MNTTAAMQGRRPSAAIELHGASAVADGREGGDLSRYFSSITREEDGGGAAKDMNPILVHEARAAKQRERDAKGLRSGALALLADKPKMERSEEALVDTYLRRDLKVHTGGRGGRSAAEANLEANRLHIEMETRRCSNAISSRAAGNRQSQIARARDGLVVVPSSSGDA